jgi:hypothetical protein
MEKIFPLNLTAQGAGLIPENPAGLVQGNPVTTRLEGGVGNCVPGLEFDHRNLDGRFFPGLVFEMGDSPGVQLLRVDVNDPDLNPATFESLPADAPDPAVQTALRTALNGAQGKALGPDWVLASITQSKKTIVVSDQPGLRAWRLVRSLEPGPVDIVLTRDSGTPRKISLSGWRRKFTSTKTGVISEAFQPGELTQSLCSPWMHDFRDCACTYWASNHPDIVLAEQVPGTDPDPVWAETPINWLRSDRALARTSAAVGTEDGNRPVEMDHYEINERWQELAIVLAGHEVSNVFSARQAEAANPFKTPDLLAGKLQELCTLEHAVALEYLYAMFSVKDPTEVKGQSLKDAVAFVRHEILVIAVSEMRHLRWANQLIWEMEQKGLTTAGTKFGPSLGVAKTVPGKDGERPPALRVLDDDTLNDFIAVEQPSGTLDGAYAQVLATLRDPQYPPPMEQLAERILADGMEHFTRFRQIQRVLQPFATGKQPAYLRSLTVADPAGDGKATLALYKSILDDLASAYDLGDMEDAASIGNARTTMFALNDAAEKLAQAGKGVPYF